MLLTYMVIGLAFALPELILVMFCPPLRRFIQKNPILELVFSLALSALLSFVMGIEAGVTIMVANVFSTIITLIFYHLHLEEKWRAYKVWKSNAIWTIRNAYHQGVAMLNAMKALLKIIFFPVYAVHWVMKRR